MDKPATPLPIYSDVEVRDLPSPDWLVEDLFLSRSLVALYGPSNVGKTFAALDLAFSVGVGQPFHGREVAQGSVVYVYAEGAPSLKFRVEAWKLANRWSLDQGANVWFIPTDVDLAGDDPSGVDALLATITATIPDPAVVVIDTLARCFGAEDENSTQAMNRFTNRAAMIREDLGSTVLVVHHTGWEEKRERGNKSLRNNFDTVISCAMPRTGRVELGCKKQKDAPSFEPFQLRLDVIQLPSGETSCALRSTDSSDADGVALETDSLTALQVLAGFGAEGATYREWLESGSDTLTEPTFKRRRRDLVAGQFVTRPPTHGSTRGFRYQVTTKGRAMLVRTQAQDAPDPTDKSAAAQRSLGPGSVSLEVVYPCADSFGANSGSNGSTDPSADSGPVGGAYRAPHGPEAPSRGSLRGADPRDDVQLPDSELARLACRPAQRLVRVPNAWVDGEWR